MPATMEAAPEQAGDTQGDSQGNTDMTSAAALVDGGERTANNGEPFR
jgi:hypothetical protein